MNRWLKGYFISSTYAQVISNQRCITNRETPCSCASRFLVSISRVQSNIALNILVIYVHQLVHCITFTCPFKTAGSLMCMNLPEHVGATVWFTQQSGYEVRASLLSDQLITMPALTLRVWSLSSMENGPLMVNFIFTR